MSHPVQAVLARQASPVSASTTCEKEKVIKNIEEHHIPHGKAFGSVAKDFDSDINKLSR